MDKKEGKQMKKEEAKLDEKKAESKTEAKAENAEMPADSKDKKIAELTNDIKRIQADFENYAKRMDKEKQEFVKYSNSKLILNLLPIIDELEIALKNMKSEHDRKGVQMTLQRMKKSLESEGVKPIQAKGCVFDPFKHEVVCSQAVDSLEENKILEEIQKGYLMHDKVLRFSKVIISKSNATKNHMGVEKNENNRN